MDIQKLPTTGFWRAAWYEMWHAVHLADSPDQPPPTRRSTDVALTDGWPGESKEHWVVRTTDRVIGAVEITLPELDNLDNAWLDLAVHPEHRRRGVGSVLLAHSVERLRVAGRRWVVADVVEPLPDGPPRSAGPRAFAAGQGAKRALEEVRRRLVLNEASATGSPAEAALAGARRRAAGYSLVRWTEAGVPEETIDGIAELDSDFLNQAPLGDLEWEPQRVDAARVRRVEQAVRDRGWRRCHTAARHDATGQVVAWTTLGFFADTDEHAWQMITLVRPDHRGHRLGTVVKLENLRYARARHPALRTIDTCNATVNHHMVAINDLMGFRPLDLNVGWRLEL